MKRSRFLSVGRLLVAAALLPATTGLTFAGAITNSRLGFAPSAQPIIEIRARARRRASGPPVAAVLGLFGAALGAAIASDRYNNYS